jgi:hypothetical protein
VSITCPRLLRLPASRQHPVADGLAIPGYLRSANRSDSQWPPKGSARHFIRRGRSQPVVAATRRMTRSIELVCVVSGPMRAKGTGQRMRSTGSRHVGLSGTGPDRASRSRQHGAGRGSHQHLRAATARRSGRDLPVLPVEGRGSESGPIEVDGGHCLNPSAILSRFSSSCRPLRLRYLLCCGLLPFDWQQHFLLTGRSFPWFLALGGRRFGREALL